MRISAIATTMFAVAACWIAGCSSTATVSFQIDAPADVHSIYLLVGKEETLQSEAPGRLIAPGVRSNLDAFLQFRVVAKEGAAAPSFTLEPPRKGGGPGISFEPTENTSALEGSMALPAEMGEKDKKAAAVLVQRNAGAADAWEKFVMSAAKVADGGELEVIVGTKTTVSP